MSFTEAVHLLVSQGWPPHYVLEEMPVDVFQDLVLVAYKHKYNELAQLGRTFAIAVGALLSKKGANGLKELDKVGERIDQQLFDRARREDLDQQPAPDGRRQPRRYMPLSKIQAFHEQFRKFTGANVPSLNTVIGQAQAMQNKMLADVKRRSEPKKKD